jgi:hypothetical protein
MSRGLWALMVARQCLSETFESFVGSHGWEIRFPEAMKFVIFRFEALVY